MGIGTHYDFQDFALITRATASYYGAGSDGFTEIDGEYMGSSVYGSSTFAYIWEYSSAIGMIYRGNDVNITFFFNDEEVGPEFAYKNTTSQTNANLVISSTTTFQNSSDYVFLPSETISTSWSDKTTSNTSRNRTYTTIASTSSVPYGVNIGGAFEPIIKCQKTNGLAIIVEPLIGTEWSIEGSALNYYQLFESTGTYSPTYGNLFFDSDFATTIFAITSSLPPNSPFQQGLTVTLTYAYTSNENMTVTIENNQVQTFVNGQLYLTSAPNEIVNTVKITTSSSVLEYPLADEFTETASTGDVSALTSQKMILVKSTAVHYIVDNFYTYNSTFTYSGLIDTTRMYSYIVFTQSCGSHSESHTYESVSGDPPVTETKTQYYTTIIPLLTNTYFVSYYALLLGTSNSQWNKSYLQKYPVNPFAIAFTSEDANRYAGSINGASNVIFTSYKFDVLNDFSVNPRLYVPINATEYSYDTANTSIYTQTIQAVSIPSAFYYGLSSATVSRTTLTANSITTTSVTGTQAVGYVGVQTTALCGHVSANNFQNEFWNPPFNSRKIMHTIGILGSSASYNMNGYFVYNSALSRTTSGDSVNPISIIGNGQVTTIIASSINGGACFPYVTNLIGYANSYR